jgi:antitoxin ParD1/3/4
MNVSVSPELKAFVKRLVASGRFRNDSEVVREGLRLLEQADRQRRLEQLLVEGLDSGSPVEMDDQYWANLRSRVSKQFDRSRQGRKGA